MPAAEDAGDTAGEGAEADTATWMTGLDGGGTGLLPPGSAFRMLAQARKTGRTFLFSACIQSCCI